MNRVSNRISVRFIRHVATCQVQVQRRGALLDLRSLGSRAAGAGQFDAPWGIAFDGAGHIIVSENSGHRVQVLRYSDGAHVCTFGSYGSGNGQFNYAAGIAVDGEGNVAVFAELQMQLPLAWSTVVTVAKSKS